MFTAGQFVEVLGYDQHAGMSGIVQFVKRGSAIIQPTGSDETIRVDTGCLTWIPTQSELRRERRKLREQHIAKLRPQPKRQGNIREYPDTIFGPDPPR